MRRLHLPIASTLALLVALPALAAGPVDETSGLVAWYTVDALHATLRDGDRVRVWPDSSGNGHDLVDEENGLPSTFRTVRLNGRPVVEVGKANTHTVTNPFELDDHTIVLVYGVRKARRGLFQSRAEGEDGRGIVLREGLRRDVLELGSSRAVYTDDTPAEEFNIAVLARQQGILRAFVNGADVSTGALSEGAVRVGRFFRVAVTRAVRVDGEGLGVSEMIFYDRYLDDDERGAVTEYLSERYQLEIEIGDTRILPPEPARVRAALTTTTKANVNDAEAYMIDWTSATRMEAPFAHDKEKPSRLVCTADGTAVRLYLSLPLRSAVDGANVRIMLVRNGETYLPVEASSGPLSGDGEPREILLETRLILDAGEYVQVVTIPEGEPGQVTVVPEGAVFSAELR